MSNSRTQIDPLLGNALIYCGGHERRSATIFTARRYAEPGIAMVCNCLSVRPSVSPSATLVDCDHTGWNSSKIITRLVSLGCSLSADKNITDLIQREHAFVRNRGGVWKKWHSAYKSSNLWNASRWDQGYY